jgi:hypothetical protein
MAENKTKPTAASVSAFIGTISDPTQQKDAKTLVKWMEQVSGEKAKRWALRLSVWALTTINMTADVRVTCRSSHSRHGSRQQFSTA